MTKDANGKDSNDTDKSTAIIKKKPNVALSLLLEITLAIIIQWKSIEECFKTSRSPFELLEKIAYIVLITIGISKPGALVYNLLMRMVDSVWIKIKGHPLTPDMSPDVEHWFMVITSFLIQNGLAGLWMKAKYISACLDAGNCHGWYGEGDYYMAFTAQVCGPRNGNSETCHYILNQMPIISTILFVFAVSAWSLKLLMNGDSTYTQPTQPIQPEAKKPKGEDPKKSRKNQMVNSYCSHCKKNSQIPVPPALLAIYCRSC